MAASQYGGHVLLLLLNVCVYITTMIRLSLVDYLIWLDSSTSSSFDRCRSFDHSFLYLSILFDLDNLEPPLTSFHVRFMESMAPCAALLLNVD